MLRILAMAILFGGCDRGDSASAVDKAKTGTTIALEQERPSHSAGRERAMAARPTPVPTRPSRPQAAWGTASTEVKPVPAEVASLVRLEQVARFRAPLAIEVAPGDTTGRLFVVERGGRIRLLDGKTIARRPFLDVSRLVSRGHGEQGLLGLAFHPGYAKNRRFYINYTNRKGDTRVVEYKRSKADPSVADAKSAREVFALAQPYANHNGGGIEFGPDGALYIGTGDGGAAGDPLKAGQDPKQRLAKMLRIDVDKANPKVEMVMLGLRNPWRYDFDRDTGDLYIGDVGQDRWEEIHVIPAGKVKSGLNLGWNRMEGNHCFRKRNCDKSGLTMATVEYDHNTGCSVTGGEVYRGKALPELEGIYFYADYCTAIVRSFRWHGGKVFQHWDWKKALDPEFRLSTLASFGHDADGELFIASLDGWVYRLARAK